MNFQKIRELEKNIGYKIPDDYAAFLSNHDESYLESPLVFNDPRSGLVEELLTTKEITQNSLDNCLGDPEKGLVHIGSNIMGGFLYIKLSSDGFGEIHYSENNYFKERFESFKSFLLETHNEDA